MHFKDLKKPIAIVGMGVSGKACLDLLLADGVPRDQIITHDKKGPCDLPLETDLLQAAPRTLVVSPGISLKSPWLEELLASGAELTSELTLAARVLGRERLIGITGAVGKSTVTSLIGAGLQAAGISSFVGGNLGLPFASYAKDRILGIRPAAEFVVLELSSYQLENIDGLSFEAALITSLTPNHMERYRSLDHYYNTKFHLLEITTGFKIFNLSGFDLARFQNQFSDSFSVWTDRHDPVLNRISFKKMALVGDHNQDNLALAARLGQLLSLGEYYIEGLLRFQGLSHRLENLGETNGVLFLNDSKATTVASVLQAALSIRELAKTRAHCWILIGGRDKNLPWADLAVLAQNSTFSYLFFGECGEKARTLSGLQGDYFAKLEFALNALFSKVKPGDLVLLSPGGTSWDEFKSFEDRGDYFRTRVSQWKGDPNQP